jgi:hypothetical protein
MGAEPREQHTKQQAASTRTVVINLYTTGCVRNIQHTRDLAPCVLHARVVRTRA